MYKGVIYKKGYPLAKLKLYFISLNHQKYSQEKLLSNYYFIFFLCLRWNKLCMIIRYLKNYVYIIF